MYLVHKNRLRPVETGLNRFEVKTGLDRFFAATEVTEPIRTSLVGSVAVAPTVSNETAVAVAGCPFWGQKMGPNRTLKHYSQRRLTKAHNIYTTVYA
jgi:hypothetical protein